MKRSRLKRRSKKQEALLAEYREVRDRWLAELEERNLKFCWLCCGEFSAVEHMDHGRARNRAATVAVETFFPICQSCHTDVTLATVLLQPAHSFTASQGAMTVLLAVKAALDAEHYSRLKVLELYGYSFAYIAREEVEACRLPNWIKSWPCEGHQCFSTGGVVMTELRRGAEFDPPRRLCARCRVKHGLFRIWKGD